MENSETKFEIGSSSDSLEETKEYNCRVCHKLEKQKNLHKICHCDGENLKDEYSPFVHKQCSNAIENDSCERCHYTYNREISVEHHSEKREFAIWLRDSAKDAVSGEQRSLSANSMIVAVNWTLFHLLLLLVTIACSSKVRRSSRVSFLEWHPLWRVVVWLIVILSYAYIYSFPIFHNPNAFRQLSLIQRAKFIRQVYFVFPILWLLTMSIVLVVSYMPAMSAVTLILMAIGILLSILYYKKSKNTLEFSLGFEEV